MIRINKSRPTKGKYSFTIIFIVIMITLMSCISFFVSHSMHNSDQSASEATKGEVIFKTNPPEVVLTSPKTEPPSPPIENKQKGNIFAKQDPKQAIRLHFMHIPKCGGTSMTAVLREVMCDVDPVRMSDCCTNPGFCDMGSNRKCAAIKGCVNHFANRQFIFKPELPSVTIMRHPVSRLVSAWFYRCHSPNSDCFQVRPEFKLIKQKKKPKAVFSEYLEMIEYNNIMTRMLGAGSFPYKNVNITEKVILKIVVE